MKNESMKCFHVSICEVSSYLLFTVDYLKTLVFPVVL